MSETEVRGVISRDDQAVPSLVHVLSTLAAYWRLCECGLEIGRAGKDGWRQKCERLESELYPLQGKIERIEKQIKETTNPLELTQLETELAEHQAELILLRADVEAKEAPIQAEWEQAQNEADHYRELFWAAREFCTKACGIGDIDLFNAALVGFDPSQLKPGQEPLKQRMSEIVSLLRSLQRHEWETQTWVDLPKPIMLAARRVAANKLNMFNVRNLKESISDSLSDPVVSDFAKATERVPDEYREQGRECGPLEGGKTALAKTVTRNPKAKPDDLKKHHGGKVFVREISKRKLEVFFRSFKEFNEATKRLTSANSE